MQSIQVSIMLRKDMDEFFGDCLSYVYSPYHMLKNGLGIDLDALHQAEHVRLCNVYRPDLSGPGIQILKDMPVDAAEMAKVKLTLDGLLLKLIKPYRCKPDLSNQ